ncbi:MAG: 50S ribosomal protein L25 [Planctomycetota bacterium]|jgi:large subunit ribosomal protein L25
MEKTLLLKAEIREHVGTKAAAKARKDGLIPCTVYGHKLDAVSITLDGHKFTVGLHHGHRLMEIEMGSKTETVMIKDLQYDYLGRDIIHADLVRVNISEIVKVTVPIELKGIAKGSHEGGIIEEHCDHIEVECKVSDIPESVVVSVKEIEVGDSVHAGDIELPSVVKLISDPSLLILTCSLVAAAKSTEELEEEAPVAPEVIGEVTEEAAEESEEK